MPYLYYMWYPLCLFKRFYTKIPQTSKFSSQYKKEYELTKQQKEPIVGIILPKVVGKEKNLLITQGLG